MKGFYWPVLAFVLALDLFKSLPDREAAIRVAISIFATTLVYWSARGILWLAARIRISWVRP